MSFKTYHQQLVQKIRQELETFFTEQHQKAESKDPVLLDLVDVLREFVLRGGKRVGPMMTVLSYEYARSVEKASETSAPLFSGASALEFPRLLRDTSPKRRDEMDENIYRLACAVEIHHLYLLNLDDMADRDVLRHGGPTLDTYYQDQVFSSWKDADHHGRTFSSIAGAFLSSCTTELAVTSQFPAQQVVEILQVINDHLFADTLVGWQIQYFQNNEPLPDTSEEQFLKGLEYVTSRYKFVGPMKIGLIASGLSSDHEIYSVFSSYGKHVGIAFQLFDDIMGVFGDPKEMGKAVGNDVREGKKTLLLQYAYRHSKTEDQQFLADVCGRELQSGELERIQAILKNSGSLEYSTQLASKHVTAAINEINTLSVQNEYTQVLKELAEYMIDRTK